MFIILTCLSFFGLTPKAEGSLRQHDSVLLCFCFFGVPFGSDVLLVRVLRFQFSAGTSWPFKALCGHSQKRLVVHYRCFYSSFPNSCFFLLSSVFPLFINSLRKADCSQPWPGSLCKSHSTEPGGRPPAAPATAGGVTSAGCSEPRDGALQAQPWADRLMYLQVLLKWSGKKMEKHLRQGSLMPGPLCGGWSCPLP